MANSKNVKTAPTKKVVAPVKKAVAPAKKAAVPAKKVVVPVKKAVAPAKKATAPAKAVAPAKKVASPAKVVAPVKKAAAPAKVVAPAKKAAAPAKVVAPAKKAAIPAKVVAPVKKAAAPAKVVAPVKKAVAPAKVVAPVKKAVSPAKVVASAKKAAVEPIKKAVAPKEVIVPEVIEKVKKVKAEKIVKVKEPKPKKEKVEKPMKAEKAAKLAKKEREDRQTNAKKLMAQIAAKKAYKPVLDKNRTLGEKHAMPPQKVKQVYVKKPESDTPILIPKTSTKNTVTFVPDFTTSVLDKPVFVEPIKIEPLKRYSDTELNEFRELISRKLESAKRELGYLQGLITRKDGLSGGDTDNRYMNSEDGTLSMEREQLTQMASRQITFIDHLEKAIIRIENKTYGVCRVTGELISKERLRAVPHATLSVEAKKGLNK